MRHPVKKIHITQEWGVNKHIYERFGLLGHNGIDYRAFDPTGNRTYSGGVSEVFAPHSGKVIENAFDANGYVHYVKIENSKEGSILAHFSHKSNLKVGQTVQEGDFISYQGTTGFSTGIHLHWGYYPIPRNRANGYSGTINQLPLLTKGTTMNLVQKYGALSEQDLDNKIFEHVGINWGNATDLNNKSHLAVERRNSARYKQERDDLKKQYNTLVDANVVLLERVRDHVKEEKRLVEELKECQKTGGAVITREAEVNGIKGEITGFVIKTVGADASYKIIK